MTPGADAASVRQGDVALARSLFESLNEREREIVILKMEHDKSYKEIAEIMNLTVSNVGFILHGALKKVQERLQGEGAPMKECEKIREWMTAYLAGELSPEDAAVLRVHLETCPACREEWKELSAAWNLTKSMLDSTAYDGTLPDGNRAEIRRAMNPRGSSVLCLHSGRSPQCSWFAG